MTNLDSVLKSRDITLSTKVHLAKAMVFPVVMYGRESWTVKKAEKILKDDVVKMLHSVCQQIWKTQQWPQDQKKSVFIPIPKKGDAKECSNYHTIALILYPNKVTLKILQARLQQYVNCEFPDGQAGFRKARETRDQIANICWIIQKAG